MTLQQAAIYMASLILASSNALAPHGGTDAAKKPSVMVSHLFQNKKEPVVKRVTVYDGPFKHGSPMLVHQEDTAAVTDCYACFHLPGGTAGFSNAI